MFVAIPVYLLITKICLYNIYPLQSHFYIGKLGFTGAYIIFLISAQKHRLWVLVRTASNAQKHRLWVLVRTATSRMFLRVPTIYDFEQKFEIYQIFLSENFHLGDKIFSIFE